MKYKDGYIALLTVLILAAILTLFVVGGLFRSAGVADIRIKEEAAERAHAAATACAEEALLELLNSTSYAGDEVLSVGGDTCQILAVGGTGNTDRIVYTTSTVLGVTRKIQINIDTVQPSLDIDSWSEVLTFTTSTGGGPPPIVYDWTNPSIATSIDLSGGANAISAWAVGTTGYIGRSNDDFVIIDASSSTNPITVATLGLVGDPEDIVVSGNYAYVASDDDAGELKVIDITTSSTPSVAATIDLAGTGDGRGVSVKGNRLYLARNNQGSNPTLHVFDISTPSSPSSLGSADVEGSFDIANSQSGTEYVFIASEDNAAEFTAVDVTNPASMSVNGSINFGGNANAFGVAVSGTVAYMGTANRGGNDEFNVVDVSTPNAPSVISSTDYERINVLRAGYGFVFAGLDDDAEEFIVFDMSDPNTIVEAATLNIVADVDGLGMSQNRAFLATPNNAQEVVIVVPAEL